ncbi:MAG TPA: hypothetical protein VKV77_12175 [Methylovirgula sp.]|nr:hypothetical protein [Methylovirgula sp.]
MSDTPIRTQHPPPQHVAVPLLFFGLLIGPAAWSLQLVTNYALAAYRCYPDDMPRATILPNWHWSSPTILAINVIAAILALVGAAISVQNWRAARAEEGASISETLGEGVGRTAFLALWGIMTGLGFFAAIIFDTIALSMVPQCSG